MQDKDGMYTKYVGTTIISILKNTKHKICIHILHDETVDDEKKNNRDSISRASLFNNTSRQISLSLSLANGMEMRLFEREREREKDINSSQ